MTISFNFTQPNWQPQHMSWPQNDIFYGYGGFDIAGGRFYRAATRDFNYSRRPGKTDIAWTRSRIYGGGGPTSPIIFNNTDYLWQWKISFSGSNSVKEISGYTKDSNGAPIANANVRLFQTDTNELISQTTSDSEGKFILGDPYGEKTFIVAFKEDSLDVAGVSVNTLVGN